MSDLRTDPYTLYGDDYVGPAYFPSPSVENLRRLPRFGYTSDFTRLFSPDGGDQAEYAAGLILLVFTTLTGFLFWTVMILTFKCMGPGNAGFLSGHAFVLPDPADDDAGGCGGKCGCGRRIFCRGSGRPLRVRVVFLVASALLAMYSVILVTMGITNVGNTGVTMQRSVESVRDLASSAERIGRSLKEVGIKSIEIRDAAVAELEDFCPRNPNLDEQTGVDFLGIAEEAKADLTQLANFINDGLAVLNPALDQVMTASDNTDEVLEKLDVWKWQAKLLIIALFVFPSSLVVGVGLVMIGVDIPVYQKFLSYIVMPLFTVTIILSYILCSAVLPLSAVNADVCTGADGGGPDDTVLTIFRNLRGDDASIVFQLVAYYTQRCNPDYYPFGFLATYLDQLEVAVSSTQTVMDQVSSNLGLLEFQCGKSFEPLLSIAQAMNNGLVLLQTEASNSLSLIRCENINRLYVNTAHEAMCMYSVDALAWIYASSLIVSVCGMVIITLRAAYYPVQYLELSEGWRTTNKSVGIVKVLPAQTAARSNGAEAATVIRPTPTPSAPLSTTAPQLDSLNVAQAGRDGFEVTPSRSF